MAHKHSVYDTDQHYEIDPISRNIINKCQKVKLMQYDHNSERLTFEIPRLVDGHDMLQCTKIEIHYINVSMDKQNTHKDVYEVLDSQASPDSEDVVIFSWLVSGNATQYAGILTFLIKFSCLDGSISEYVWNTEISKDITISAGIDNGESIIVQYSDVLEAWKTEVLAISTSAMESAKADAASAKLDAEKASACSQSAAINAAASANYSQIASHYAKEVESVKAGTSRAFYVDTKEQLERYLLNQEALPLHRMEDGKRVDYSPKSLDTGDTIYVKELNVPDFWWLKTDSTDGAYSGEFYDGVTREYASALTERSTISKKMAEVDAKIEEQNQFFFGSETVVNTDCENLKPDYSWYYTGGALVEAGTKGNPYIIGSPAQLLAFSNLSNGTYDPTEVGETEATIKYFDYCYFIQTANIDMGGIFFTPIAMEEIYERNNRNYSRLQYDGLGHYISNFKQSGLRVGGVFGYIGGVGDIWREIEMRCGIRNLTVKNVNIHATNNAGAVVAVVSEDTEIVNCHADETCIITTDGETGGVVGYINDLERDAFGPGEFPLYTPFTTKVAYCTSKATVKSNGTVAGGVIGYIDGCFYFRCEYCTNRANISVGYTTGNAFAGGIIGYQRVRDSNILNVRVSNCYNYGQLYVDCSNVATLGGLYGYLQGMANSQLYITECYDYGVRSYVAKNRNNNALVGRFDAAMYQFISCKRSHASNHPSSGNPYYETVNAFIMGVSTSSSNAFDSCSYVATHNTDFVDTFGDIVIQLQPLEGTAGELKAELDELRALVMKFHTKSFKLYCTIDRGGDGTASTDKTFEFTEGETWGEFATHAPFTVENDGTITHSFSAQHWYGDEYAETWHGSAAVSKSVQNESGSYTSENVNSNDTIESGVTYHATDRRF